MPQTKTISPLPAARKADARSTDLDETDQTSAPGKSEPLTLARLEAMPLSPTEERVPIEAMTLPQLEATHAGLERMEALHEKMSGACATLRGLVLTQIKAKLPHGEFKTWLETHYDKSDRAARGYMRLGKLFAESKTATHCRFAMLGEETAATAAELDTMRLDLTDPTVAAVMAWSEEKSATQLLMDFSPKPPHPNRGRHKTAALPADNQTHEQLMEAKREEVRRAIRELFDSSLAKGIWKILDDDGDASIRALLSHHEEEVAKLKAWLGAPKAKRARYSMKELLPA